MTVAIMCEFASQVCLLQQKGVSERISHAELDTEYTQINGKVLAGHIFGINSLTQKSDVHKMRPPGTAEEK